MDTKQPLMSALVIYKILEDVQKRYNVNSVCVCVDAPGSQAAIASMFSNATGMKGVTVQGVDDSAYNFSIELTHFLNERSEDLGAIYGEVEDTALLDVLVCNSPATRLSKFLEDLREVADVASELRLRKLKALVS